MAAVTTRIETCFTYMVRINDPCSPSWQFTIVVNQDGSLGVRNLRSPRGGICDSMTEIPGEVLDAINDAKGQVENILVQTSSVNGTLTFTNQTSQSIVFATPFANDQYRVYVTLDDFIDWRITNQTTTGFDIELNVTYTGEVGYDVLA
jgi:hypothetical protein